MRTFYKTLALLLTLCLITALWTGTAATAAAADVAATDTYVYCFDPNPELYPSYYSFYTKRAVCNSPPLCDAPQQQRGRCHLFI